MNCLAAFLRAKSRPVPALTDDNDEHLKTQVQSLFEKTAEIDAKLKIVYGSDEETSRLQEAVDKNMKYLKNKRPKRKYQHLLLDSLLKGADPCRLREEDDFIEAIVHLKASTVGRPDLQKKYQEVVKLSPAAPLITLRMKSALAEVRAVESAAHMTSGHQWFMVVEAIFDTCSDLFMFRVYYDKAYYFFMGMSAFGIIGNVYFSSRALEELNSPKLTFNRGPEITRWGHVANVLSVGVWSNYKLAEVLVERPNPSVWKLMRNIMRANAFEAGWAILPNIYTVLTSGILGDGQVSKISMVGQLISTISSVVMLAQCVHIADIVTTLVLCETDSACWRWFTGSAGRCVMFVYRLCEMCAIVLGLVFSAAARPFGPFYWLAIRGSTTFLAWYVYHIPLERKMYPGATVYNPFAFHGVTHIRFGMGLRLARQIEVVLVFFALWLVYQGLCWATPHDGDKWTQEFGLVPFSKKLACTHETRPGITIGNWSFHAGTTNFCNSQGYARLAKLCVVSFGTLGSVLFMLLHVALTVSGVFPARAAQNVYDEEPDSSEEDDSDGKDEPNDDRVGSKSSQLLLTNFELL